MKIHRKIVRILCLLMITYTLWGAYFVFSLDWTFSIVCLISCAYFTFMYSQTVRKQNTKN